MSVFYIFFVVLLLVNRTWSANIHGIIPVKELNPSNMSIELIKALTNGVQMALESCQLEFRWDRWNCPDSAFSRRGRQIMTRETAYVVAITAAGIVHSVTKSCSRGELPNCGCDPRLRGDSSEGLRWGGCSDNVAYGEMAAEKYLDSIEWKHPDWNYYINKHNNAVGRTAVRESLQTRCKCHGLSGSCTTQTCWMQLPNFKVVAKQLREKYEQAVRLNFDSIGQRYEVKLGNGASFVRTGDLISESDINDLTYMDKSPNYCDSDITTGWYGVIGRSCSKRTGENVTLAEQRSCRTLCRSCRLRVRKKTREITYNCNCRFSWCCEVSCDICKKVVEEHYCE